MKPTQHGFTLIEIAIVLVVIGLLLGGMLKGQEMMTQGRIRNLASDLANTSTAIYGYQDRYRRLPGDDDLAGTRWKDKTTGGNGGGSIGDTGIKAALDCATDTDKGKENCLFWQHLRLAGFIAGDSASTAAPRHAAGGLLQIQQNALGLTGQTVCATALPGKIAGALDAQMDDGKPATGQMRATSAADALDKLKDGETAYQEDDATTYAVCKLI